jgi:hypothetical protein
VIRRLFRTGQTENDRIEAFSDGVLAIVITLLVLEITPPTVQCGDVSHGVERQSDTLVRVLPRESASLRHAATGRVAGDAAQAAGAAALHGRRSGRVCGATAVAGNPGIRAADLHIAASV